MNVPKSERKSVEEVSEIYSRLRGNIRATAKHLGISRSSVRRILAGTGLMKKPLVGGSKHGNIRTKKTKASAGITRYILTSAQNNTHVHGEVWANLKALAEFYGAKIMVGTFTYNQNQYGKLAVKRGQDKGIQRELWYDETIESYIVDSSVELAKGLVWCGEMNTLPTAVNPLAGFESYSGRNSTIFPHAKLAMRSLPTMQGEGTKLSYTTGTVTQRNYIAKREGLKAEFHHIYGGLLVEVDSNRNWWVRQLNYDAGTDSIQDLNVLVQQGGVVSTNATIEAITHGDLHGTMADPHAVALALDMVDTLQPKYQFMHDIMEGASINPHARKHKATHTNYQTWLRGLSKVETELQQTAEVLAQFDRPNVKTVIVDSNHDDAWLKRWLCEYDYKKDPANSELFLKLDLWFRQQIRNGGNTKMIRDINVLECAIRIFGGYERPAKFLIADESFLTCDRKIENGMHGHRGPSGRFGTPENLKSMGRKANTAHTHAAGIYDGLYVAGTLSKPRWDYAQGPNSWTQSETLTYGNGKRAIVTFYAGKWRA
jgi:hypothetical protein